MKNILLLTIILLGVYSTSISQYTMSNTTVTACNGTFLDPGGAGNYANSQDFTMTFCSGTGQAINLDFTSFDLENNWDYLYIYDGTTTASPTLGTFTGTNSPGIVSAPSGCITIRFTSDGSITAAGFDATISCGAVVVVPTTNYLVSGVGQVDGCTGTVYDPGGTNVYANNQNFTRTFCSGTGDPINLNFTQFVLENNYDYVYLYDGPTIASPLIGSYTGSVSPGSVTASSGCITVRFTSDISITYAGFAATISCITTPCVTPVITPDAPTTFCAGASVGLSVPPSALTNNGDFLITVSSAAFLDEVSWTLTNSLGAVVASGGNYALGSTNNIPVTLSDGPFVFNIESLGTFGDNTPTYTVNCVSTATILATGTLTGGSAFTSGSLACAGAQAISNVWTPSTGLNTTNGNSVIASPTATTTYTVTSTEIATGCVTSDNITVTVTPGPVATASPNSQIICSGQNTNISLSSTPTGATFSWTVLQTGLSGAISGNGSTISQSLNLTGGTSGTATYTVTPTSGTCAGNPINLVVTVNQLVTPTFTQIPSLCSGGTFTLPTTSLEGIIGTWSPVVNATATTTYTFTPNAGQCANTATMTVSVLAGLDFVNTQFPASATICEGSTVSIFGQAYEAGLTNPSSQAPGIVAEYGVFSSNTDPSTWPASAWSAGTYNPNSLLNPNNDEYVGTISGLTVGTYYYAFRFSLNGCSFQYGGYSAAGGGFWDGTSNVNGIITVNSNTTPTFNQVPAICSGASLAPLPASSLEAITGTWSPSIDNTQTTTYSFTPSAGLCATTATSMTIVVNSSPVVTATPSSQTICSGDQTSILLSSSPAGATFNWSVSQTNVTGGLSGTGNAITDFLNNNSTSIGNASYTITPTLSGCNGTSLVVPITVNPIPTASATPFSQTICSGSSTNISLNSIPNGASFSWSSLENLATGSTNGSGTTISQILTATTSATGTVTYSVIPTYNSCSGSPINVVVSVESNPLVTATPISQSICSGTSTSINLASVPVGATFNWSATTSGVSGAVLGNGSSINQTLYSTSTSTGTASYIITPNIGACIGNPITVVISVNPIPSVVATPSSQSICSGSSTNINLTSSVLGASFAWISNETNAFGAAAGNGNSILDLLTTTTSATGTVTYTITPTASGCVGLPTTASVIVNPLPVAIGTPASQSICSGTQTGISLSSTPAGATFSWTVLENGVVGASVGSSNTISQTLTATGATTGTANYLITPAIGSCVGSPFTIVVSVNPSPAVIASPSSQTICSGSTATINLSSLPAGATFGWTISQSGLAGAIIGNGTVISQTLSTTGPSLGTVTYSITPSLNGCSGSILNATVDVNPIPVVSVTPSSQNICSGGATSINMTSVPVGATFDWLTTESFASGSSSGSGPIIVQTLVATTLNTGVVNYAITPSLNSCVGTTIIVPISIAPNPTAIATPGIQTICSGSTSSIGLTSLPAGANYTWTTAESGVTGAFSGSGNLISQQLNSNGTSVGTATYTITPQLGTCIGSPVDIIVTVNPNPILISNPLSQSICSGANSNFLLTSDPPGASFSWIVNEIGTTGASSGTGSVISQNLSVTGIVSGSTTYTIIPSLVGCIGIPTDILVTVNPTPSALASPISTSICSGNAPTVNLSSTPSGATFDWTVNQVGVSGASNNSGNLIDQTLAAAGTTQGSATYTIIPTLGSCIGNPIDVPVFVNPVPVVTASPSLEVICSATSTGILLSSSPPGASFDWTVNEIGVTGASLGSGNAIVQVLTAAAAAVGSVTYTVTPSLNGCVGSPLDIEVTVNPIPTAILTPVSQTICSGDIANIELTSSPLGSTFEWTAIQSLVTGATAGVTNSISQVLNTTTSNVGTVTYNVIPTFSGCVGQATFIDITVNPNPEVIPTFQTICEGTTSGIFLNSIPAGATFNWTSSEINATGSSSGSGATISQVLDATALVPGTVTYTVNSNIGACVGVPVDVIVTVNPLPSVIASQLDPTICANSSTSINLSSVPVGSSFSWTILQSGTTGATAGAGSTIAQTLGVTGLVAGTATYSVTPTLSGCAGSPLDVVVTVDPTPTAIATPTTQSICSETAFTIDLSSSPVGSTFGWTVTELGETGGNAGTGSTISDILTVTGIIQGTATYTVTPTLGVCVGLPINVPILVNPIPVATALAAQDTICSATSTSITLSSVPMGATFDWTSVDNLVTGSSAGAGNSISQVLTSTSTAVGSSIFTITPTLIGCVGLPVNLEITVNPLPTVVATPGNETLCSGETSEIVLTSSPAGSTFDWTVLLANVLGGSNGFGDTIAQTLTSAVTGTSTYNITPTLNGCAGPSSIVVVTVNPNPSLATNISQSGICVGDLIGLNVSGADTYNWSPSLGLDTNVGDSVVASPSTTQTYFVTGTNLYNCSSIDSIAITVNPTPVTTVTLNDTICEGLSINLDAHGADNYSWTPSIGLNSITDSSIVASPLVTTTYTVTGIGLSCSTTATVTVFVKPAPIINAGVDSLICYGNSIVLSGSGAVSYAWSGGVVNNVPFFPTASQTYTVVGTAANQCKDSDQVVVSITPLPIIDLVPSITSGCVPQAVDFQNNTTGASVYNWDFGDGTSSNYTNPSHSYISNGCYDITLTASTLNGCTATTTYPSMLCIELTPAASFFPNPIQITTDHPVSTMVNTSQDAIAYSWDFGDGTGGITDIMPEHTFPGNDITSYSVQLVAYGLTGCTDTARVNVQVFEDIVYFVPNSFTPDNDGYNQTFKPVFTSGFDPYDYSLFIYNRWGQIVFESHDASIGWEGTYGEGNEIAMDGTYVWTIEFKVTQTSVRKKIEGHVNLLR